MNKETCSCCVCLIEDEELRWVCDEAGKPIEEVLVCPEGMKESHEEKGMLNAFIVSWHASGYNGTFRYLIAADDLEDAKALWASFVESNKKIQYSWEKAEKGVKNHYGGYISWEEKEKTDKERGCYELQYDKWNVGSDHLND